MGYHSKQALVKMTVAGKEEKKTNKEPRATTLSILSVIY